MIDSTHFVHMNNQVFDREAGRFQSVDPIMQDIANLQSIIRSIQIITMLNLDLNSQKISFFAALEIVTILIGGDKEMKP